MNQPVLMQYPAGSLLRLSQICRDPKSGRPSLVPFVGRTWLKMVERGEVSPGRKIGRTRVWSIEEVLAVGDQLSSPAGGACEQRGSLEKARAALAVRRQAATNDAASSLAGVPLSSGQLTATPGAPASTAAPHAGAGPMRGPVQAGAPLAVVA
jgi:hypothetical protein